MYWTPAPVKTQRNHKSTRRTVLRRGRLPWSGLSAPTKRERFALMLQRKQRTSIDELSEGMPRGFEAALRVARGLAHDERPDYHELRRLLASGGAPTASPSF